MNVFAEQSLMLEEAFSKVGVNVDRINHTRIHQPDVGVWWAIVPPQDRAARVTAFNKARTVRVLAGAGVPTPRQIETTPETVLSAVGELGWPVVVKPNKGSHARGVTTNIRDEPTLRAAVNLIPEGRRLLVEEHLEGEFRRVVVARGRAVHILTSQPAYVTGDGTHTIAELAVRANPLFDLHPLVPADTVPEKGETVEVQIVDAGGAWSYEALPVADHPDCVATAEKAATAVGLVMATVEMIHTSSGPVVFDVNAKSNLWKHINTDPTLVDRIVDIFK